MSQDKDELAKLLGEMAEGVHAEDEHAAHADHDDHVGHLPEPIPPPAAPTSPKSPPKPTAPTPIAKTGSKLPATPPRPALKPPSPKPSPATASAPPRSPVKPALPPRPAAVPQPQAPAPTPKPLFTPPLQSAPPPTPIPGPAAPPASSAPIISDEEEPERYSGTDDDAVIVPAMDRADFIPKARIAPPRRQHLAQKLYFKQTIIPILLTLGLICLAIPTLGLLSSQYSPFKALAEIYFLATFWPLGLAFLVFAFLTMFSVKKELELHTPPSSES